MIPLKQHIFNHTRTVEWPSIKSFRWSGTSGWGGWRRDGWIRETSIRRISTIGKMWDEWLPWKFSGNRDRNCSVSNELSNMFSWTFPHVLLVFADNFNSMENSDSPRWKSYKMPCLLLSWRFLERYSWTKVIWSVLQFLSPKFDSSGRGPHKPHHKLLYSGGVISDDVWSCKVFTFQHISTEPWKITVLNYTLIWLYNLHILTSIYIPLN